MPSNGPIREGFLAIVVGPYRDPRGPWFIVQNIRAAEAVSLELWQAGIANICPHLNSSLMDGAAPDEVWLAGGLEMLRRCDAVVVLPGWELSTGTAAEVTEAMLYGKPIYYWPHIEGL